GKAAIFADDLNRWFFGLWKGKKLARTVSLLSITVSLLLWRLGHSANFGTMASPAANDDETDGKARGKNGVERRSCMSP
ncbi:MAG: hypothetical protein LBJ76_01675, partial [Candidatus Accumulibacter sp.]|nr:hypothetical protein [Accumulibacter sp.]